MHTKQKKTPFVYFIIYKYVPHDIDSKVHFVVVLCDCWCLRICTASGNMGV